MAEHPIQGLMDTAMGKIKEMIDVDTIIGDPITTGDTTIIPVSKVSFGFASGGSDIPSAKVAKDLFGGGSGAGITISPIAFIVISNGDVKLLQMSPDGNPTNSLINLVPEVVDKISGLFNKDKDKKKEDKEDKE